MTRDSFHFASPFLDFFVQVMVFCNYDWTSFKLTSKNQAHILLSLVAYWLLWTWHNQTMSQQMDMLAKRKNKKPHK